MLEKRVRSLGNSMENTSFCYHAVYDETRHCEMELSSGGVVVVGVGVVRREETMTFSFPFFHQVRAR